MDATPFATTREIVTGQKCQLPKGTWNCSRAAINALSKMTAGQTIRCVGHDFDDYGRLIARCSTEAEPDLGARLVASGLAWALLGRLHRH